MLSIKDELKNIETQALRKLRTPSPLSPRTDSEQVSAKELGFPLPL